jgi:DNA processing protein
MRDMEYWIWLSSLEGMGPVKAMRLLEMYKNPQVVFGLSEHELKNTGFLTLKNISELLDRSKRERTNSIYRLMLHYNIKMVNICDECYPNRLKHIYAPPIALYYRGQFDYNSFSIAVVGSRRTTVYGSRAARKLSYDLALRGVRVVSGLARGIDSIAHTGCISAGGKTTAVLGCGLDSIYPPENNRLFNDIIDSGGLILSEYPPGMPPLQHNFPARNRIISGISSGVLVVEAAKRSGSLITAGYALEQGREVFAVPGNADSAYSRGTNQLIKDGAKLVLSVDDILEEFEYGEFLNSYSEATGIQDTMNNKNLNLFKGLTTEEIKILKIILKGIHHIDEIIERSNAAANTVASTLFMLEMKGVVCQEPGKMFVVSDS